MLNNEYYDDDFIEFKIEIAENKREYVINSVEFRLNQLEIESNDGGVG